MPKYLSQLDKNLPEYIAGHNKLVIRSSKINSVLEKYVLLSITEILKRYDQIRFVEMVYTITKELAINGVKANQKRIFFEDEGLNITDETDYAKGIVSYRQKFSDTMADTYGKRCLSRGIHVQISFQFREDGMVIEVVNNTQVIKNEEVRMREKMKKAMGYNDIAEFYMDNMDNTEGAGLGIALIMILLKNEQIDPNLFRIIPLSTQTLARVEIPFNENYISVRSRETAKNGN